MRELAEVRKTYPWLVEGSSVLQQAALRDLDRAFQNRWKNPGHFSHPTWRKAGVDEGFYIRDLSVRKLSHKWGEVLAPKTGWIRFRLTRQFSEIEASTSARVTLDRSGRWHISFTQRQPELKRVETGARVGLDMGVVATVGSAAHPNSKLPITNPVLLNDPLERYLQNHCAKPADAKKPRFKSGALIFPKKGVLFDNAAYPTRLRSSAFCFGPSPPNLRVSLMPIWSISARALALPMPGSDSITGRTLIFATTSSVLARSSSSASVKSRFLI